MPLFFDYLEPRAQRPVLGSLVLLLLLVVPASAAQELGVFEQALLGEPAGPPRSGEELEEITDRVASGLRCPVCQGLSIADSPADMAVDMRAKTHSLLAEGYSPEQVIGYFEGTYGEFVRLAPKAQGFNLVVWLAPLVGLMVGAGLVALYLRRRSVEAAPEEDEELEAFRERVRREVTS